MLCPFADIFNVEYGHECHHLASILILFELSELYHLIFDIISCKLIIATKEIDSIIILKQFSIILIAILDVIHVVKSSHWFF